MEESGEAAPGPQARPLVNELYSLLLQVLQPGAEVIHLEGDMVDAEDFHGLYKYFIGTTTSRIPATAPRWRD